MGHPALSSNTILVDAYFDCLRLLHTNLANFIDPKIKKKSRSPNGSNARPGSLVFGQGIATTSSKCKITIAIIVVQNHACCLERQKTPALRTIIYTATPASETPP